MIDVIWCIGLRGMVWCHFRHNALYSLDAVRFKRFDPFLSHFVTREVTDWPRSKTWIPSERSPPKHYGTFLRPSISLSFRYLRGGSGIRPPPFRCALYETPSSAHVNSYVMINDKNIGLWSLIAFSKWHGVDKSKITVSGGLFPQEKMVLSELSSDHIPPFLSELITLLHILIALHIDWPFIYIKEITCNKG